LSGPAPSTILSDTLGPADAATLPARDTRGSRAGPPTVRRRSRH